MNLQLHKTTSPSTTAEDIERAEKFFYQQARELADLMSASHLQKNIDSDKMHTAAKEFTQLLQLIS